MSSRIPIQNVYYLLLYAWDRLQEGGLVDVEGIDSTELVDLYAAVLLNGVRHLMRRGLDQAYVPVEEELAGIRGRVRLEATARRLLTHHGRAHCEYDNLSVDTVPNRILVATMRRVCGAPRLSESIRRQLIICIRRLRGITPIRLSKQLFGSIQLHGNNGFYKFLLSVCALIQESAIVNEVDGTIRFRDFDRDPMRLAALFERFVYNFIRIERPEFDVKRERILWSARSKSDPDLSMLPSMQTDISVRWAEKTLIIDTKFYERTLQSYFEAETIHPQNLYQIFAYLSNLEARGGADARADGMLLYPSVGRSLRLSYEIGQHVVKVCTLDLAKEWRQIRSELFDLLGSGSVCQSAQVNP